MLHFQPMDRESATSISKWRYESPYDFYNMGSDDIEGMMTGSDFALIDEDGSLVGFFCVGSPAQVPAGHEYGTYADSNFLDIGLGMRPDLTGSGMGYTFVSTILEAVEGMFEGQGQRVTVATFNTRAIRLYEKLGFANVGRFRSWEMEFVTMERT